MNNLICPVSVDRVPSRLPRLVAFLIIGLLGSYIYYNNFLILVFVGIDFFIRGFLKGKYSALFKISKVFISIFKRKGELIDLAPKIFAARLGFVFTSLILLLHLLGMGSFAVGISFMLIVLASLECIANVCVGCVIYSYVVYPLSKQNL